MTTSRREFAKLGTMGIVAQAFPRIPLMAQAPERKIGYCIIGIGRIADHYLRAFAQSPTSKVTGLVSGHRDKAEKTAAQYGVSTDSIYSYEQIDRIHDNKAIDAVIVCLPNSMHAEYTIRSAKAGKHVLCEKPMAISVAESESMIAACKAANVKLMIAYRLQYEPLTLKTIKLIRDGAIGQVHALSSANGFNIAPNEWRSTHALAGGGPLMDVGIYCLNATRYLTGEEPTAFTAVATTDSKDPRFQGVEEDLAWTERFPSGAVASCTTTYGASMSSYIKVYGSKGMLEFTNFNYAGQRLTATYRTEKGAPVTNIDESTTVADPSHFVNELDHFSHCIIDNQAPKTAGEEGLKDMKYIQAIYRSAGITMG